MAGTCAISLVADPEGACVLGKNYGCYTGERKMWTIAPCKAQFVCEGFELQCRASRITEKPGRVHNCSCFEHEQRLHAGMPMVVGTVPAEIAESRLVEGNIRKPRFVANTTVEMLHATFTFWNLLDRVMLQSSHSNYQTGYVREMQVRRMIQLVNAPGVRTYCEIGMNGGHSASSMLLANPALTVHSFDIMYWNYSWPVANLLSTAFGSRFVLHPGNSRATVPQWHTELGSQAAVCDMLLVDGDHSHSGAVADLQNFRPLAMRGAPVVVDDIATAPGAALKSLERSGLLLVRENYGPYDPPSRFNRCLRTYNRGVMCLPWGFSVVEYV